MLQVSGYTLQQVEKFKCLGVVFTSDGKRNMKIGARIGKAYVILRELYRFVVAKRGFSVFKHSEAGVFKSVFAPTIAYSR